MCAYSSSSLSIDSKLEKFTSGILKSVTQIVDEKLSKIENQFQTLVDFPEEINNNCETFSDALSQNSPATQTVTETLNR